MITTHDIDGMRRAAGAATGQAAAARDLALDIERRRQAVLERDRRPLALHTPEVWTSRAATRSRVELTRDVGRSLWLVGEDLRVTTVALHSHAEGLDSEARALRRRADAAETSLRVESARQAEAEQESPGD